MASYLQTAGMGGMNAGIAGLLRERANLRRARVQKGKEDAQSVVNQVAAEASANQNPQVRQVLQRIAVMGKSFNDRLSVLEAEMDADAETVAPMAQAFDIGTGWLSGGGLMSLVGVFSKYINASDTVVNTSSRQLAAALEGLAIVQDGQGNGNQAAMFRGFAALLDLHAYYDPDIGLASVLQADGASSGGSSSDTPTVAQLIAFSNEVGETGFANAIQDAVVAWQAAQ